MGTIKYKIDISRTCGNCDDFDKEKSVCTIRYVISNGKRNYISRIANQKGCPAFMFKI